VPVILIVRGLMFEYKIISTIDNGLHETKLLNDLGKRGWELAAIRPGHENIGHLFYLKRTLTAMQKPCLVCYSCIRSGYNFCSSCGRKLHIA